MNKISFTGTKGTSRSIRFIVRDEEMGRYPERIHYFSGYFGQNCRVVTSDECNQTLYSHTEDVIYEITNNFEGLTGLNIPSKFYESVHVWNVKGLLYLRGAKTHLRVLRSQIILGADTFPIAGETTEKVLMHAIGNALWNFLTITVWNWDRSKQNEYRRIRGIPEYIPNDSSNRRVDKDKHNLFFIAAEDFRYLFGTPGSGRGEWFLPTDVEQPVPPPGPDVSLFWQQELSQYDASSQETP